MGLVVFMVVGFIVLGWATPTEAQHAESLEYLYSPLLLERSHSAQSLPLSEGTVRVGAMVFLIIMNSTVFSQMLSYSGASGLD